MKPALAGVLSLSLAAALSPAASAEPVRVGVVLDGPWSGNAELVESFQREILELSRREFDVRFPEHLQLVGDYSPESVSAHLESLLANDGVEMVLALGTVASHQAATRGPSKKPLFAPLVLDARLQGLPRDPLGGSGVPNLSYLTLPGTIDEELVLLQQITPFRRVAMLIEAAALYTVPSLERRLAASLMGTGCPRLQRQGLAGH